MGWLSLAVVTFGMVGCAIAVPHVQERASTRQASGAVTPVWHRRSRVPRATMGRTSPARAIADFATIYINWTAGSVASQLGLLALASVGQARAEMALAAAQARADRELHAAGIANSGTVEAIAPPTRGARSWVVVTRERTLATRTTAYAGLAPAWHVTIATVVRFASGRWVVSGWQPES